MLRGYGEALANCPLKLLVTTAKVRAGCWGAAVGSQRAANHHFGQRRGGYATFRHAPHQPPRAHGHLLVRAREVGAGIASRGCRSDESVGSSGVGEAMLEAAPRFEVLQKYIQGHRQAIVSLDSLEQRREFSKWMREVEEELAAARKGTKVRVCVR